jgi:hypothetical protein
MRRLVRLLGAFLTGLLVVAAPASAGTFGAPQLVTNEGFAPQAAIGADGTTALAWIATTPGGRSHRGLAFATRGPDGSAGPTQELATSSGATRVAVADDGTATVAWVVGGVLRAASAAPGAMLGTAQVLASGVNERDFALAAGPAETIVTWSAGGAVRMAVRRGPEGFGPAEDGFGVPIAMDAAGTAFSARRGAGGRSLEMARRPTGGSFGAPQVVGAGLPGSDRAGYAVTLDALDAYRDGSVGVMLTAWEDAYTETRWVAAAGPGEALREPVRLDRASTGSGPPMVTGRYAGRTTAFGVGPAGAVLTATERMNWSRSQSDALQVQLVGADGVARQPELVPGLTGAHGPRVAFDASGAGVIVTSSARSRRRCREAASGSARRRSWPTSTRCSPLRPSTADRPACSPGRRPGRATCRSSSTSPSRAVPCPSRSTRRRPCRRRRGSDRTCRHRLRHRPWSRPPRRRSRLPSRPGRRSPPARRSTVGCGAPRCA